MKQCAKCSGTLVATEIPEEVTVAGATFTGTLPGQRCEGCGETYIAAEDAMRFDLRVARELARSGVASGEAFRFMRKSLQLRAVDLAELLNIAAETVSRWERGERPVDRAALTVLSALVADKLEGRATTMKFLQAQREPAQVAGERVAVAGK